MLTRCTTGEVVATSPVPSITLYQLSEYFDRVDADGGAYHVRTKLSLWGGLMAQIVHSDVFGHTTFVVCPATGREWFEVT